MNPEPDEDYLEYCLEKFLEEQEPFIIQEFQFQHQQNELGFSIDDYVTEIFTQ